MAARRPRRSGRKAKCVFLAFFAAFVILVPPPSRASAQAPQSDQRPPVFRAGAHYVRVDAYPTTKDGRIVEGLTKDDFELYEDGRLQAIESFEYIAFPAWTPEAE